MAIKFFKKAEETSNLESEEDRLTETKATKKIHERVEKWDGPW